MRVRSKARPLCLVLAFVLVSAHGKRSNGQAGSEQPPPPAPQASSEVSAIKTYEIDVTPTRVVRRGVPDTPYKNQYEFTPENIWFPSHIPLWESVLENYKAAPNVNYLEIGCYEGGSIVWMLENILTDSTSRLTCIDPFVHWMGGEETKKRLVNNVTIAGGAGRMNLIVGYSQVELRKLPLESYDVIYVDGDHSAAPVLEDAVLSWRLLKPDGLMIFDDYDWEQERDRHTRPSMAVDFFTETFRTKLEVVHRDYQLILKKKTP